MYVAMAYYWGYEWYVLVRKKMPLIAVSATNVSPFSSTPFSPIENWVRYTRFLKPHSGRLNLFFSQLNPIVGWWIPHHLRIHWFFYGYLSLMAKSIDGSLFYHKLSKKKKKDMHWMAYGQCHTLRNITVMFVFYTVFIIEVNGGNRLPVDNDNSDGW